MKVAKGFTSGWGSCGQDGGLMWCPDVLRVKDLRNPQSRLLPCGTQDGSSSSLNDL